MRAPLDVLTAVGRELATSRDEEQALAAMAPLLVPALADWVSVGVREADGRLRRVAVVHRDPARAADTEHLARTPALVPAGPVGDAVASPSGHVLVYEHMDEEMLDRTGIDAGVRAIYRRLGYQSAASVALVARGRLLGGMLLVHGESGRRFTAEDVTVLEDLARRCALAVDAVRLRREVEDAGRERDVLLATAPVAMALVGPDGTLLRLNHAMADLAGRSVDECRGLPLADAVPDLAPGLAPLLEEAASGRPVDHGEVRRGERVWTVSAYPVAGTEGGAPTGLVLSEVTRDRAASAELARRAAEQAAVADLGRRALSGASVDELVGVAAAAVAATTGADLVTGTPSCPGEVAVLEAGDPPGPLVARGPGGAPVPETDVTFLRAVGTTLAEAAARQRAEDEVRASRRRLVMALEAGGMGSFEWDLASGSMRWTEALSTAVGAGLAREHPVAAVVDLVHPEDRDAVVATVQQAVDARSGFQVEFRLAGDGDVRWVESRGAVVGDRVLGLAMDVTDRRRGEELERAARVEAEAARERLAFLAEASAALGGSLDAAEPFLTVARMAVPRLADWCVVDAVDAAQRLRQAAVAHRDPAAVDLVAEARRRRETAGGWGLWSSSSVAATGRSQFVTGIDDARLREVAADEAHLAVLRALGPRSAIVVPLVGRERVVGVLTLVATGEHRPYGPDDVALAEDLARRAAAAVDNARLFEDRSRVAAALQQTLLPPALPDVPGVELAACYRASAGGADISGDFYDVFETGDGAWAVVIGDVCGKGPAAAGLTGLFRHTIRAAAVRARSPRRVLTAVNDALLGQIDEARFGSVAFARLVRDGDDVVAAVASGGHPLPVVVRADGSVAAVDCPGTVLGVVPAPVLEERVEVLRPGDALVLYTDGVTEARRGDEQFGEQRLLGVLAAAAGTGAGEMAGAVESAALAFQGGVSDDDMAVIVVRIAG